MTDIKIQQYQKTLEKALESDDPKTIVAAYIDLGQAYLEIQDTTKGYTQFDQALKVAKKDENLYAKTRLLGMIGICLKQLGNYDSAMQSFRKSLRTAKKIDNTLLECDAQFQIGALLVDQDEPLEAISHLDNALLLALQIQDRKRKLAVTNLMGNIFLRLESIDKAVENYATALETAREIGNREAEAASRVHLGQTFLLDEDFESAIENFELALDIADQLGLVAIEMQALFGLTQACAGANRTSLAGIYGEQVVNKAHQAGAQAEEVQAILTLANIFSQNDQNDKSIPYLLRGLEIAQEKQDKDWELKFLADLGIAYYMSDDLENANDSLGKAYEIAAQFQRLQEEAYLAGQLASVRADQGELESAIELNKRAIQLSEENENQLFKGEQLVFLAMNSTDLGIVDGVQEYLKEAKEIFSKNNRMDLLDQVEEIVKSLGSVKGK